MVSKQRTPFGGSFIGCWTSWAKFQHLGLEFSTGREIVVCHISTPKDGMQEKHRAAIWRQSLRVHCQLTDRQWSWSAHPHWLVVSHIGRIALLLKLRQLRPFELSILVDRSRLDPLLDAMVDEMGLRQLHKPSSFKGQLLCFIDVFSRLGRVKGKRGRGQQIEKGANDDV